MKGVRDCDRTAEEKRSCSTTSIELQRELRRDGKGCRYVFMFGRKFRQLTSA